MCLKSRISLRGYFGMLFIGGLGFVLVICMAGRLQAEKVEEEKSGGNSKCYVCHAGMKTEELTTDHLAMDVTCDKCHGPSIEHMHDEMLMTEPDILIGRSQVVTLCTKCHGGHENPDKVEAFRREWAARIRPNGRNISDYSVCTDCHGTHNIANKVGAEIEQEQEEQWVAAFNGSDLSGWKASGGSSWKVRMGRLYGTPSGEGKPASLWSDAEYSDYLMAITFRVDRPVEAGVWVRGDVSKAGVRVEILRSGESKVYSGSVRVAEKGLALVNLRSDLLDEGGWNTLSIRVEGDRVQVWLNAEEIGAVRTGGPTRGKIGLYVSGKGGEFCVREVQVRKLDNSEKSGK